MFNSPSAGPPPGSGQRKFQRWHVYDTGIDTIIVWQSGGAGVVIPVIPVVGGSAVMPRHEMELWRMAYVRHRRRRVSAVTIFPPREELQ